MSEEPRGFNHLNNETSPYLKQHLHNPVDWYPWGEEALQKAKDEDKLIFLSIGYSTCHWCHVMAHEAFSNRIVADILNAHYVCIKVDREERPDIDTVYMNYCQMMTGRGGWPLNLFLTPDQVPVYAGTYFPVEDRHGRPGFTTVITHIHRLWNHDKENLMAKGNDIRAFVKEHMTSKPESTDKFLAVQAFRELEKAYDEVNGGFSAAPKFPSPHHLLFLMTYHHRKNNGKAMDMVVKTLEAMYSGGIYDHVGGGFARYATDERWLVPHFEKMLYDNALLLRVYNEAYRLTQIALFKTVAYGILAFLRREMLDEDGAFYTALDADSEGEEGKYYVFSPAEIAEVLGEDASDYADRFDITDYGNFEGKSIPNLIGQAVSAQKVDAYKMANDKLLKYREKRIRPSCDTKLLTSMNGLMVGSLSHMYRVHGDLEVLAMAEKTAGFIDLRMSEGDGLRGSWTDGKKGSRGVLEDYAYYIDGLIELYQSTFNRDYLERAATLTRRTNVGFWDMDDGGYFMTDNEGERLIARPKTGYDNALPSGNSMMALNLLKLSRMLEDAELQTRYDYLIKAFGKQLKRGAHNFSYLMVSYLYSVGGTRDLMIVLPEGKDISEVTDSHLQDLMAYFTVSLGKDKEPMNQQITYYLCEDFICHLPVTNWEELQI